MKLHYVEEIIIDFTWLFLVLFKEEDFCSWMFFGCYLIVLDVLLTINPKPDTLTPSFGKWSLFVVESLQYLTHLLFLSVCSSLLVHAAEAKLTWTLLSFCFCWLVHLFVHLLTLTLTTPGIILQSPAISRMSPDILTSRTSSSLVTVSWSWSNSYLKLNIM